jgi:two-component system CheB/CheR fusion protein
VTAGSQADPGKGPAGAEGLSEAAVPFAAPAATLGAAPPPPPIVAIGASAGGLEAIEQFFGAIEAPSRFAFVIVQHLSPDFKNLMVELLARRTTLKVEAVEDGMPPSANTIHLIPPGKTMTIEANRFRLAERDPRDFAHHPIDAFFVSLAADRGADAIGVVLSGSGSDGGRGAWAISVAGGRVLVQLPATARFSSMPQAAIEAGCAAEVMLPAAMATALLAPGPGRPDDAEVARALALSPAVVDCLAQAFDIDLAAYRADALQRRVQRRMMRRGFDEMDAYAAFLADDEAEQEALYHDLMIGHTAFLPDQAAIGALERGVVAGLAARLDAGRKVRAWVPGCATGEEAYGLAILLLAHCREPLGGLKLEVRATDIHRRSLAIARAGFYSEEAVANVPAEWRQRFFTRRGSGYQVVPAIADRVVIGAHDLIRDPPLARLHLVSCRNVLSCLADEAQARVLGQLAEALLPGGYLLLGQGETVEGGAARFTPVDAAISLYRRRRQAAAASPGGSARAQPAAGAPAMAMPTLTPRLTVAAASSARGERRDQRLVMAHELLLDRYVPPSLLLDEMGQVIHSFGDTAPWLESPGDRSSLDVLDMVRDALRAPLAAAIDRARLTGRRAILDDVALAAAHGHRLRRPVVEAPLVHANGQRCLLVSFDDRPAAEPVGDDAGDALLAEARGTVLEAALAALVEAAGDATAVAEAAGDRPLRITAANPAFAAAGVAAGLALPLDGQPLSLVLEAVLAGEAPATDRPGSWVTRTGGLLTLQPLAAAGHRVAILRLLPKAALSTPAATA